MPSRRTVLLNATPGTLVPDGPPRREAPSPISHQGTRRRAGAITLRRRAGGRPTEVRGSQTVQRPHPELTQGLQGALHTGLQLIVHRSHEVLTAPGAHSASEGVCHIPIV